MIAAEKWYEYQKSYKRYGLDMKPGDSIREEKSAKTPSYSISTKDKIRMSFLVLFAGMIGICLIVITAYSAQLKFDTNYILAEADSLQGEIENLNVAIKSAGSISIIEEKAIYELGMIYPAVDQIAFVNTGNKAGRGFASTLKQLAYKE
ncbi:hypothetical protein MASR2M70_00070 [Bacillota bacterium]